MTHHTIGDLAAVIASHRLQARIKLVSGGIWQVELWRGDPEDVIGYAAKRAMLAGCGISHDLENAIDDAVELAEARCGSALVADTEPVLSADQFEEVLRLLHLARCRSRRAANRDANHRPS